MNQTITPCINIRGAAKAIEFYKDVFGAVVKARDDNDKGLVAHADLMIGQSLIMMCDEEPEIGALSPDSVGGCPFLMVIKLHNAAEATTMAVERGATIIRVVDEKESGIHIDMVRDPFGFRWGIMEEDK